MASASVVVSSVLDPCADVVSSDLVACLGSIVVVVVSDPSDVLVPLVGTSGPGGGVSVFFLLI